MVDGSGSRDSTAPQPLAAVIDELAHLLPAQGPISIFIHHNPLHALEHLPFEEAVETAAVRLGCEPFLAESRYRDKLASGRILPRHVDALLHEELGARGAEDVGGIGSRFELWRALVLHGFPEATGSELAWVLEETSALSRLRTDLPASARSLSAAASESDDREAEEERAVRRLWSACLDAVGRSAPRPGTATSIPVRHRDLILDTHGLDTDGWITPSLRRFVAGYLDQGLAHWTMPARDRGIHGCFLELYRSSLASHCGAWARALPAIVV